jgi:peptidyl-prolyl cis-trans isomerase C
MAYSIINKLIIYSFFFITLSVGFFDFKAKQLLAENSNNAEASVDASNIAAIVNGDKILIADIDKFMKQKREYSAFLKTNKTNPQVLLQIRQKVLDTIINRKLMLDVATKSNQINEAEINKIAESVITNYGGEAGVSKMLVDSDLNYQMFVEELKNDLRVNKYLELAFLKDIQISENELKEVFEKFPNRYSQPESARARHILIKVARNASPGELKTAKDKIDSLYSKSKEPNTDFSLLAKENSQCPSAQKGGDLGYFGRGAMVPEFEKTSFALNPGEISSPIQTDFGYHIIKLEDKKEAVKADFESSKNQIERDLRQQKQMQKVDALITELRKNATVELKL